MTPEEVRQQLLDASQQIIAELSDEELEVISGGGWLANAKTVYQDRFQLHPENILPTLKAQFQRPNYIPGGTWINGKYRK